MLSTFDFHNKFLKVFYTNIYNIGEYIKFNLRTMSANQIYSK